MKSNILGYMHSGIWLNCNWSVLKDTQVTNWQKGQEFSCLPSNGWHKPKAVLKSTDIFIAHWVKLRFCYNLYRDYCTGACLWHLWQIKPFQCHYDSRVKITSKNRFEQICIHDLATTFLLDIFTWAGIELMTFQWWELNSITVPSTFHSDIQLTI